MRTLKVVNTKVNNNIFDMLIGENSTESDNVTQENSSTNSHSPQVGLNLPTDNSPTSTKLATEPTSSSTSHTNVQLTQLKSLPTLESNSSLPTSNSSLHTSKIQPGDCSSHIQQENTFSQPGCEPVDKKFTQPVDILQTSQGGFFKNYLYIYCIILPYSPRN